MLDSFATVTFSKKKNIPLSDTLYYDIQYATERTIFSYCIFSIVSLKVTASAANVMLSRRCLKEEEDSISVTRFLLGSRSRAIYFLGKKASFPQYMTFFVKKAKATPKVMKQQCRKTLKLCMLFLKKWLWNWCYFNDKFDILTLWKISLFFPCIKKSFLITSHHNNVYF